MEGAARLRGNPGKAPGHGLGLSIARALVDAGGGTITYQPLSPGARFTVSLPA